MEVEYGCHVEWLLCFIVSIFVIIFLLKTCCWCCEEEQTVQICYTFNLKNASGLYGRIPVVANEVNGICTPSRRNKCIILLVWLMFFLILYWTPPIIDEYPVYDPFAVLGVDEYTPIDEIKRVYRRLSIKHHPDRGGDSEVFKELAQAYRTLTNPKAYENWKKYGNPDGLKELHVGYAAPKWLSDPKNGMIFLCSYIALLVILPCCLCVCPCRSWRCIS